MRLLSELTPEALQIYRQRAVSSTVTADLSDGVKRAGNAEYTGADGSSSGKTPSSPVIRMIFSSDGRAEVSLSWRPACRACRATLARTPSPEASQKVSPDRSTVTGTCQESITSLM